MSAHVCTDPLLRIGDVVTIRDWRTGEPYTPSPVEGLRLNVGRLGVDQPAVCAACLASAPGVRVETVAHAWYVQRGEWARDVLHIKHATVEHP